VPRGAWPSYASGYYERDNDAYIAWDEIAKERESFTNWLEQEIYSRASDALQGSGA
jgi:glutaconate CoA-transferase subunit A